MVQDAALAMTELPSTCSRLGFAISANVVGSSIVVPRGQANIGYANPARYWRFFNVGSP